MADIDVFEVSDDNVSDNLFRCVTFQLDNETYGVNVMQVQEVLRCSEIDSVPGSPDYVLGIINLRGCVVTVIDTRVLFSLPNSKSLNFDSSSRIIIVEIDNQVVGMLVDSVKEVINLDESQIDSRSNINTEDRVQFIRGVFNRNNDLLIIIDLDKILKN